MAVAAPLTLHQGDLSRLAALTRSTSVRAGLAKRARIVLLAAEGLTNAEIARRTGLSRPTVLAWRHRYGAGGIIALQDKPRSGRPAKVDEIAVVATTLADDGRPPERLGAAHWSSRLLAKELGLSFATVARIWRKWGIQPRRVEAFTFSIEPQVDAGAGLYHNPPEQAMTPHRHRVVNAGTGLPPADRPEMHPDPWLDLVEVSLDILTHQAIRRGTLSSVHNLIEALGALTDGWSDREEPRTRSTGRVTASLAKDRKATSGTRQPCTRFPSADVDLLRNPDQSANRPRNRMSLRAEFHGTRCGGARRPEPPGA